MIVTEIDKIKNECKKVSLKEGLKIGEKLLKELDTTPGIGLAANQIGIDARVCVIKVKEPIILVNPEIVEKSKEKFVFLEGCLSFPEKTIKTIRYKSVKVKADNHTSTLYFSVWNDDSKEGYDKKKYLEVALETACIQHEIDHLDGITMFDREFKPVPIQREGLKIGRNDKVLISKGIESKVMKYKKAEKLLDNGWVLVKV